MNYCKRSGDGYIKKKVKLERPSIFHILSVMTFNLNYV